jgi:hypothetical protein
VEKQITHLIAARKEKERKKEGGGAREKNRGREEGGEREKE